MGQAAFTVEEQRRLILEEFPPKYERVEGKLLSPKLGHLDEVPVPPEWSRKRLTVPEGYEYATLAKELENFYPPQVREVLVNFVQNWLWNVRVGCDLLITGPASTRKRLWAGSAVMNEVMMRFGAISTVTAAWINAGLMKRIVAMDVRRDPEYVAYWNRLVHMKLLMVVDPHLIQAVDSVHLNILYQDRIMKHLPTITTFSSVGTEVDWDDVQERLGEFIGSELQETTKGYIAHY